MFSCCTINNGVKSLRLRYSESRDEIKKNRMISRAYDVVTSAWTEVYLRFHYHGQRRWCLSSRIEWCVLRARACASVRCIRIVVGHDDPRGRHVRIGSAASSCRRRRCSSMTTNVLRRPWFGKSVFLAPNRVRARFRLPAHLSYHVIISPCPFSVFTRSHVFVDNKRTGLVRLVCTMWNWQIRHSVARNIDARPYGWRGRAVSAAAAVTPDSRDWRVENPACDDVTCGRQGTVAAPTLDHTPPYSGIFLRRQRSLIHVCVRFFLFLGGAYCVFVRVCVCYARR